MAETTRPVGDAYDLSLQQDSSSEEYGLMLAKDAKGIKLWRKEDAPSLSPQFFTTSAEYAAVPPLQELVIAQDLWHAGFGQQNSELPSTEDKRYRSTVSADARFKGRILPGPGTGTLTAPTLSNLIIPNADFEGAGIWAVASGNGSWDDQNSTQAKAGTYSGKFTAGTSVTIVAQSLFWTTDYQSKEVIFTCWIYQTSNVWDIGIYDGVGVTYSSRSTDYNAWIQLTVTRTLDASATELTLRLRCSNTGGSLIAYFDEADATVALAPSGNYVTGIDFNGATYITRGAFLQKYIGSGNWIGFSQFDANITDLAVFGDQLLVAIGTSNKLYYSAPDDDTSWTQDDAAQFEFMAVKPGVRIYGNTSTFEFDWQTAIDSVLAGAVTVGDKDAAITDMLVHTDALVYVMKEDQPFQINASDAVIPILPDARYEQATTSGKNAISWKGDLFIPLGTQTLTRWRSATDIEDVSPALFAPGEEDYGDRVLALAADARWQFVIIDNSTLVEVLAVRRETIDTITDWRYHPIQQVTLGTVNYAFVSNVGTKRLWLLPDSADAPTFVYLPENYADPANDSNYNFATSAVFYTPWYDGGFPDITKAITSFTLLSANLNANRTVTVKYQYLGDSSWTALGSAFVSSPSATKFITTEDTGKKIRFEITLATNDAADPPEVLGYIARGALMPTKLKQFTFAVRVADKIENIKGLPAPWPASEVATALNAMDAEVWPVILRDKEDTDYTVKFQSMTEEEVGDELEQSAERVFTIVATEVKLS